MKANELYRSPYIYILGLQKSTYFQANSEKEREQVYMFDNEERALCQ